MVRGDQYLSSDFKTKFIETLVAKIQGGVQQPPPHTPTPRCRWLHVFTKNKLVRRGLTYEHLIGGNSIDIIESIVVLQVAFQIKQGHLNNTLWVG